MRTRVLVVDDDPAIRRTVERILVRASYEVVTSASIDEALRHAANLHLDAAIVDYALVGEDGLTLLSRLRDVQPPCLRILMTGHTDFPMVVDAINRGEVLRVIRKPFDTGALLEGLTGAFNSAKRMAQVANAQKKAAAIREREMLGECIEEGHLRLALQPIVNHDNVPVAYEALLRSSHPVLDGPPAILRVAERAGRINAIGATVFSLAAEIVPTLKEHIGLFVNLHPLQLEDPNELQRAVNPLAPYAEQLTIEITERSRLHDIDHWDTSIDALCDAGFTLAIDDLGSGYNSLVMLADLQPRFIKLDMSLVRHVESEPRKQRLVHLVSTFAEATGAQVIAEGVETRKEADCLIRNGAHLLQGYYFGRPAFDVRPGCLRD